MKHIEMTVTTNERAQDVFRLKTEPKHIDVVLTEDNGTNDLKTLFARLLQELFKDDVEVKFVRTDGYKTRIYEDVCREYVSVLNQELITAREKILEEKLPVNESTPVLDGNKREPRCNTTSINSGKSICAMCGHTRRLTSPGGSPRSPTLPC